MCLQADRAGGRHGCTGRRHPVQERHHQQQAGGTAAVTDPVQGRLLSEWEQFTVDCFCLNGGGGVTLSRLTAKSDDLISFCIHSILAGIPLSHCIFTVVLGFIPFEQTEGAWLPVTQAASASQNVTNNSVCEKACVK